MKSKNILLLLLMSAAMAFVSACGTPAAASQQPTATVPVITENSQIIAEGRLEPIRYAEIAFNASGVISDVPVTEGQTVKKRRPPHPPRQ